MTGQEISRDPEVRTLRLKIEDAVRLGELAAANYRRTQSAAPEGDRILAGQKASTAAHLGSVIRNRLLPIGDGVTRGKGFYTELEVDPKQHQVIEEARGLMQ